MKEFQVEANFTFVDIKGNKKFPVLPLDEDGKVADGTYERTCQNTKSQKATARGTIELFETAEEIIDSDMSEEAHVGLVNESLIVRARKKLGAGLKKDYETPEQRETREKREKDQRGIYVADKMEEWEAANPDEDLPIELFKQWREEARELYS